MFKLTIKSVLELMLQPVGMLSETLLGTHENRSYNHVLYFECMFSLMYAIPNGEK